MPLAETRIKRPKDHFGLAGTGRTKRFRMRFLSKSGQFRVATGAIFGFLLGVVVAPSKAGASCGDYVQRGTKSAGERLSMPQNDHSHPTIPGESKFPCSGPNCSRGSQAPIVPVPTAPPSPNQWAMGLSAFILTGHEPVSIGLLSASAYPVKISFSVFHPPRISFS